MPSFRTEDLEIEGSFYIGTVISAIFYGIYLGVYFLSTFALLENTSTTRFRRAFYISFGSVFLLLNTIFFTGAPYFGRLMWVTARDKYPGGPLEYYEAQGTENRFMLLGDASQNLAISLGDGLLIYRCYVVFGSDYRVIILPILCTLGALGLGMATIPIGLNQNSFLVNKLNAAGITLSTAINVMITVMISIKILCVSRSLKNCGESHMRQIRTYTNVVAILVESAAPCAVLGIMTCVTQFMINDGNSSTFFSQAIFSTWSASIALFPQLIVYRVAQGNAWTKTTSEELSRVTGTLLFAPHGDTVTVASDKEHSCQMEKESSEYQQ